MSDEMTSLGGGVKERLARIEAKVDSLCTREDDKEKRIRSLERSRWILVGIFTTVAFFKEKLIEGITKIFKA